MCPAIKYLRYSWCWPNHLPIPEPHMGSALFCIFPNTKFWEDSSFTECPIPAQLHTSRSSPANQLLPQLCPKSAHVTCPPLPPRPEFSLSCQTLLWTIPTPQTNKQINKTSWKANHTVFHTILPIFISQVVLSVFKLVCDLIYMYQQLENGG